MRICWGNTLNTVATFGVTMRVPLYIEFQGKKVAIIGGGGVGTLRARKFIEAGAEVTVYSLNFSKELLRLSRDGRVKLVKSPLEKLDFDKIASDFNLIVVAVGSKDFNDRIVEAARRNKALVNLANDAKMTEVVVPFEGIKNGVRFAVTTEGKSGVVARKVRDKFQRVLEEEEELFYFLDAMDYLKSYMKLRGVPINMRMKLYSVVSTNEEFIRLVKEEKVDEARKLAEKIVEECMSGKRSVDVGGIEF